MNKESIIKNYNQFLELKKNIVNIQLPPQEEEYDLYNDIIKDELKRKQIYDSIYK